MLRLSRGVHLSGSDRMETNGNGRSGRIAAILILGFIGLVLLLMFFAARGPN